MAVSTTRNTSHLWVTAVLMSRDDITIFIANSTECSISAVQPATPLETVDLAIMTTLLSDPRPEPIYRAPIYRAESLHSIPSDPRPEPIYRAELPMTHFSSKIVPYLPQSWEAVFIHIRQAFHQSKVSVSN